MKHDKLIFYCNKKWVVMKSNLLIDPKNILKPSDLTFKIKNFPQTIDQLKLWISLQKKY